jgi:hypothetical protein
MIAGSALLRKQLKPGGTAGLTEVSVWRLFRGFGGSFPWCRLGRPAWQFLPLPGPLTVFFAAATIRPTLASLPRWPCPPGR